MYVCGNPQRLFKPSEGGKMNMKVGKYREKKTNQQREIILYYSNNSSDRFLTRLVLSQLFVFSFIVDKIIYMK